MTNFTESFHIIRDHLMDKEHTLQWPRVILTSWSQREG